MSAINVMSSFKRDWLFRVSATDLINKLVLVLSVFVKNYRLYRLCVCENIHQLIHIYTKTTNNKQK